MDLYAIVSPDKIALGKEIEEKPCLDKLTLDLRYNIKRDRFEVNSNIMEEGRISLVETFLRDQIGKGKDERKANKKKIYNIRLEWYPENDNIVVSDDTGNKGLRDGILMNYLTKLGE